MTDDSDGRLRPMPTLPATRDPLHVAPDAPPASCLIFDPEIDEPYSDVLFEFIIAGTWETALGIIDKYREITGREAFWTWVKGQLELCVDGTLRHHLAGQCLIGFRHLTDDLSPDEREFLHRYPKPRAQGDLDEAHRIYSMRDAAIAAGNVAQEKRILREVLAIDPCAAPVWRSLTSLAQKAGDESSYDRCLHRFALALMARLDIGLFALRHGVQKVARSNLESCLSLLSGNELLAPTVAVSALTALASLHGDLAQIDVALGYLRRACEIVDRSLRKAEEGTGEAAESPFNLMDIVPLRISLAYATIRAGRFDEAEALLEEVLSKVRAPDIGSGPMDRRLEIARARILLALVSYHLTLDVFCADFGGRGKYFLPQCRSHNGLNPQGSYPLHPRWREHSGRM